MNISLQHPGSIEIKPGIKYLGQQEKELPYNCLFQKGRIGCGATSVALWNDLDYIVCVPTQELVDNKISQSKTDDKFKHEVFGIYNGITKISFKKFLINNEGKVKKIMVVYDSLWKVFDWLYEFKENSKNYNLLIDEYHLLLTEYSYRGKGIETVLDYCKCFKNYTFMTATPIEDEFVFDELKHLPIVNAVWPNLEKLTIKAVHCGYSVLYALNNTITDTLNEEKHADHNMHIFCNSLDIVNFMVKTCCKPS